MSNQVIRISAKGTAGDAKGKLFEAKPDSMGRYVLNKKSPSSTGAPTNMAVNKVYVANLDEAAKLLATDDYLINLVSRDGSRALREFSTVKIDRASNA